MKCNRSILVLSAFLLAHLGSSAQVPESSRPSASLRETNSPTNLSSNATAVIKLVQAGLRDDVVLAYVKGTAVPYNLSANDILDLKSEGVSA